MGQPLLEVRNVCKSFFGVSVLKNVSLSVEPGRVMGLVGENGAGKSTLMYILGGIHTADSGQLLLAGQAYAPRSSREARERGVSLVHQELNLFSNLSIAENIFLTDFPGHSSLRRFWIDHRQLQQKTAELLKLVELPIAPSRLIERLSPGERQTVEIAKGLHSQASVLILDEPTTSLTEPESQRLFEIIARLRTQGLGIIFISHSLGDVLRVCDDVTVLRDGEVQAAGKASEFNLERLMTSMVGRKIEQLYPARTAEPRNEVLLEVRELTQPGTIKNVSFSLHRGEVLGISGLMGAGRTELARILFGLDPFESGIIRMRGSRLRPTPRRCIQNGIALLTENRREEGLLLETDIADNTVLASLRRFAILWPKLFWYRLASTFITDTVQRMRIACRSLRGQSVKTLSGGNQQKVVLAKWLLAQPRVLILDEPTRGVDVGAKTEIYQLINELVESGSAILLISSEIEELMGMCDRILVMTRGEIRSTVERSTFHRELILRLAFGEERLR